MVRYKSHDTRVRDVNIVYEPDIVNGITVGHRIMRVTQMEIAHPLDSNCYESYPEGERREQIGYVNGSEHPLE